MPRKRVVVTNPMIIGIAESSGAGDPSHGKGVMEPDGEADGAADGDARNMDQGESPGKADEGIVLTN